MERQRGKREKRKRIGKAEEGAEEQGGVTIIPPTPPLSLSCSISCLGHHVLRHPDTSASPLHANTRGKKQEGGRGAHAHKCSPGYTEQTEKPK